MLFAWEIPNFCPYENDCSRPPAERRSPWTRFLKRHYSKRIRIRRIETGQIDRVRGQHKTAACRCSVSSSALNEQPLPKSLNNRHYIERPKDKEFKKSFLFFFCAHFWHFLKNLAKLDLCQYFWTKNSRKIMLFFFKFLILFCCGVK